ncbi:unnamed protein product [Orchesella dallaii]|uniref:Uncharacterized protein n=1 Tax=Orchesella dallaii TaxID=48710 RepID=A0ABP1RR37_9HEXA
MPTVRFSNLNHKWYDSDGNLHSEFDKHHGKSFSLFFKTSQHDKNGVLVPFEGSFNLPYNLAEASNQNFEGVEAAENKDFGTVHSYSLVSEETTNRNTKKYLEQTAYLAACYPSCKLSDSTIQRNIFLAFFAFDDHLENLFDLEFPALDPFLKWAYDIMKNKIEITKISTPTNQNVPEILWNYLKYIGFIEKKVTMAENGTNRGKYFREAFLEYLQASVVETRYVNI